MTDRIQFPLTVRSDGEEFVINKEDDPTSPDHYLHDFDGDRGRSKRRRRCGQCGPCQVKENCNKCNFCQRRDVLKQTCIYRKCVYLRSKPKPYPHLPSATDTNRVVSPPGHLSASSSSIGNIADRPNSCGTLHNESSGQTNSIINPFSPVTTTSTPNFLSGESLFKPPVPQASLPVPQPVLPTPQPTIPVVSSPDRILPPQIPPYNVQNMQTIGHNTVPIPSGLSDKVLSEPIALQNPLHDNPCSSFTSPASISHIHSEPGKYDNYFNRFRQPTPPSDSHSNLPSPCMYHPGFPSSFHGTTAQMDRTPYGYVRTPASFPPYLPSNSNMLRHLPSLPHRYPIHPPGSGRFGEGFPEPPQYSTGYNNYGFQPTDMQMPIHPSVSHHHHHLPFSNINRYQAPHYEQSNMCPKNVYGPPAFPSLALGALRVQERPHGIPSIRCDFPKSNSRPFPWEKNFFHPIQRPNSAASDDTSKLSTTSSGFECDVISIDDIEMNAYIRSDGCNSIEIEFEDPSSPSHNKTDVSKQEPDLNSNYKPSLPRTLSGKVTLKQDMGEEGVIQLEIPGEKVTIEETELVPSLAKYSCNLTDLLKFIESEPRNWLETQNDMTSP